MTRDLRAAYDADLELDVRCKASAARNIQVCECNTIQSVCEQAPQFRKRQFYVYINHRENEFKMRIRVRSNFIAIRQMPNIITVSCHSN